MLQHNHTKSSLVDHSLTTLLHWRLHGNFFKRYRWLIANNRRNDCTRYPAWDLFMHFRIQFLVVAPLETEIVFWAIASNGDTKQQIRIISFWKNIFILFCDIIRCFGIQNFAVNWFLNEALLSYFYTGRPCDGKYIFGNSLSIYSIPSLYLIYSSNNRAHRI